MGARQDRFDEWVGAGLLEASTAEALRRYEEEHGRIPGPPSQTQPPPETVAPADDGQQEGRPRALALVGEILGYFGAVLAITAISFLVSQSWSSIPIPGRVVLVSVLTAVVCVAGVAAGRSPQDAAQRLASALLLATVVCAGWLAWVSVDAAGVRDEAAALWTFIVATAVAVTIYVFRRKALAQLAMLAGAIGVVAMTLETLDLTDRSVPGIALTSLGVAWVALGATQALAPAPPALIAGGLVAVFGANNMGFDEPTRGLALAAGVVLAVSMLALAVLRRDLITLMIPGGIGLLTMVPQLIEHLVGGAMATWAAVLVTGVVLILVAVRMLRAPRSD